MKKEIIILIVIFLVSLSFVNAGNNVKDAEPSVSSFDVVKSNEQDLYTGDLNLNLPLLNVPGRNLDVPISLTYSSGIRVDDEASWVGLGWNLGVGAITRAVNNEADDGTYGFLNAAFLPPGSTRDDEGAQDSYFVTFQGGGGKIIFVYNPNLQQYVPQMQSWKPWKIEYSKNPTTKRIDSWSITTEDGTKYIFAKTVMAKSTYVHRYVYTKRISNNNCLGGDSGCYDGMQCNVKGDCKCSQCVSAAICNPTPPPGVTPKCQDGLDNDGDGCIDYPADAGCASSQDNDESQAGCAKPDPKIVQVKDLEENSIESKVNLLIGEITNLGVSVVQLPATGQLWNIQPRCDAGTSYPIKERIYLNNIESNLVYEPKDDYASAWYLTEIIIGADESDTGSWVRMSYKDEGVETFISNEKISGYNKESIGVDLTSKCAKALQDHPAGRHNPEDNFCRPIIGHENDRINCEGYLHDANACNSQSDIYSCEMRWFWSDVDNYNYLDCEFLNSQPLTNRYDFVKYSKIKSDVNFIYLDKIETGTNYALFKKSNRNDLKNINGISYAAKKLDDIEIYRKDGSANGVLLRKIHFNYNYDLAKKNGEGKLTLLNVQKIGYDGTTNIPSTTFEYGFNPELKDYAYDWWGFYNGQINNVNSKDDEHGANDSAKAWSLTKITYPMKGSVSYEYEVDRYNYLPRDNSNNPSYPGLGNSGGGIRVKSITENDGINPGKTTLFNYEFGAISVKPVLDKGLIGTFTKIGVNEKNYVAYGRVNKQLPGSNGNIVTTFLTITNISDTDRAWDSDNNPRNIDDWKVGQKISENYKKQDGTTIKLSEYDWNVNNVENNGDYGQTYETISSCQGRSTSCATRAFLYEDGICTPGNPDDLDCQNNYCHSGCELDTFNCQYEPYVRYGTYTNQGRQCFDIMDINDCNAQTIGNGYTLRQACVWDLDQFASYQCGGTALSCGQIQIEQDCRPEIGCSWIGDKKIEYGWITQNYIRTTLDEVQTQTDYKNYNIKNGLPTLIYEKGNDNEGRFTEIKYAFEVYDGINNPLNMKDKNMLSQVYSTSVYEDTNKDGIFNPGTNDLLYSLTTTEYSDYNGKIYPSATVAWIDDGDHVFETSDKILRTTYDYDIYGNLIQVTEPATITAPNGILTKYYYGGGNGNECNNNDGTLLHAVLTCVENNIGQLAKKHYDSYGNLIESVGLNNEIISYQYDALGRLTKITNQYDALGNLINPLGGNKDISYNYATTITPSNLNSITILEDLDDIKRINSVSYFDGFGNSLKLESKKDGETNQNKILKSYLRYNEVGLQSEASITTTTILNGDDVLNIPKSTTTYYDDPLLRVKEIQPVGSSLKITNRYEDYENEYFVSVNKNEDGRELKTYTDKFGRLAVSQSYDGTFSINYYDIIGNVKRVVNPKGQQTLNYYDSLGRLTRTENNDFGYIENVYDSNGNNIIAKDHNGQIINYEYDSLNRVKKIDYANENEFVSDVIYYYDNYNIAPIGCVTAIGSYFSQVNYPKGRLTVKEDNSGINCYYYNKNGQLAFIVKPIKIDAVNTNYYGIKYNYNKKGLVSSITYPAFNKIINYEYDEHGRLKKVKDGNNEIVYNYNNDGTLNQVHYPNNVNNDYTYDNRLFLKTSSVRKGTNSEYIKRYYEYDNVGNIDKIFNGLGGTELGDFNYDTNYRLDTITSTAGGYGDFDYNYDEIGNIQTVIHNTNRRDFIYDSANRNKLLFAGNSNPATEDSEFGDWSFTYDDNGNIISKTKEDGSESYYMYYDYNNNLVQVNFDGICSKYYYDGDGNRYKKIEYDAANDAYKLTKYIYGADGRLLLEEESDAGSVDCGAPNMASSVSNVNIPLDNTYNTVDEALNGYMGLSVFGMFEGIGNFFENLFDGQAVKNLVTGNAILDNYEFNINDVTKDGNKLNILVESKTSNPIKLRFTVIGDSGNNQIYSENYVNAFETKLITINYDLDIGNLKTLKAIPYAFENNEFVYYSLNEVSYSLENVKEVSSGVVVPTETITTTGTINPASYLYVNDGARIIKRFDGANEYYYSQDYLSSVNILTNSNGDQVSFADYYAFGARPNNANKDESGSVANKYKYTGKEFDNSQLYYYGARYYDPSIMRFISIDPIFKTGESGYAYAGNNPMKFNDPSGEDASLSMSLPISLGDWWFNLLPSGGAEIASNVNLNSPNPNTISQTQGVDALLTNKEGNIEIEGGFSAGGKIDTGGKGEPVEGSAKNANIGVSVGAKGFTVNAASGINRDISGNVAPVKTTTESTKLSGTYKTSKFSAEAKYELAKTERTTKTKGRLGSTFDTTESSTKTRGGSISYALKDNIAVTASGGYQEINGELLVNSVSQVNVHEGPYASLNVGYSNGGLQTNLGVIANRGGSPTYAASATYNVFEAGIRASSQVSPTSYFKVKIR